MCVHEIAAAATADAMGLIYDVAEMDPASMIAVKLTNAIYTQALLALQEMEDSDDLQWPVDVDPECN